MDNILKLRAKLNTVAKSKISVNDLVIKAASLACQRVPETNSSWVDGTIIRRYKNVNMSIAVQTDYGLMAPVIEATNLKVLIKYSKLIRDSSKLQLKSKKLLVEQETTKLRLMSCTEAPSRYPIWVCTESITSLQS